MTREELLAEFREAVDDKVAPYAWTNRRALHWLSEGQDKFCEETGFFADSDTYQVEVLDGVAKYSLDPRIIEVQSVYQGDTEFKRWTASRDTGYLTLLTIPAPGTILTLRVQRYAVQAFSAGGNPEIPPRFHLAMVEYAAYKAFSDHDRERQDPVKAKDHLGNFNDHCVEGSQAAARIHSFNPRIEPHPSYVV